MCIRQITEIHSFSNNYGFGTSFPSQNSLNILYQNLDNIYGVVTTPSYMLMYIENNTKFQIFLFIAMKYPFPF